MGSVSGVDGFDTLNSDAVYGTVTVGLTPVELKVGANVLADRRLVTIQPEANKVYWGYDNSVTISNGTRVFKDQFMPLAVGDEISIWLVADGAGKVVRIGELA